MTPYRKDFDETKYMSFLIKDNELLEKCNEIWGKVTNSIKKELNSESVYNKKYLKTKIKSYKGKINANFLLILNNLVYRKDKKKKKIILKRFQKSVNSQLNIKLSHYITDDINISSDNSNNENSNE